jgi:hypothetical protein
VALLLAAPPVAAQDAGLGAARADVVQWLARAPTSPLRAVAHQRIDAGVSLGASGTDIALPGLPSGRVRMQGAVAILEQDGTTRALPRGAGSVPLGPYRLRVSGSGARAAVTVFGSEARVGAPSWYPVADNVSDTVTLSGPRGAGVVLLAPDGSDVEAVEAGRVVIRRFGSPVTLTVRELPGASPDERDLEIYFRDATNGYGSYPAGRYVTLTPIGGGRYVVDFNTARNPWCAYNTVFPCPPPWPGNAIGARVAAGERYGAEKAEKAE